MSDTATPPYDVFPIVSNDKISLRQILNSDVKNIMEISFYDSIQATTLGQAIEMNSNINSDYEHGNSIHWGIVDNFTRKMVGTCGYYRGFDRARGELGCVLLPQFRGRGYMTPALSLAIEFGFHNIGLSRICAITHQQNEKAMRLLERLNFKKLRILDEIDIEFELLRKSKPNP